MNGLNSRRLIVVAAIVLAVTTALLYSFRAVVRELIIIPVSYWIWIIGLFLNSTPQYFFWIIALLIVFIIAWRSFIVKEKRNETVVRVPDYSPATGRVSYWATRVNLMRLGVYYQSTFNEALARLAIDLIGYRHRISNRQIERGLSRNTLRVPNEVRNFLLANLFQKEYKPVNLITYLYRAIRLWWISRFPGASSKREQLPDEARALIQYMEEELEVHYDNAGQ